MTPKPRPTQAQTAVDEAAPATTPPAPRAEHIQLLPIDRIKPSPDNPRHDVSGRLEELTELADSIRANGILQPIVVINVNGHVGHEKHPNGTYQVIMGHRRLAAAQVAGLDRVPAIVREYSKQEQLEVALVENLQRTDISPLEEARGYQRLAELGLTQREIAARIGCSQGHISKRLALLGLSEKAVVAFQAGTLDIQGATKLLELKTPELMDQALKKGARDIEWAVESVQRDVERERKLAKATEEIQAHGWKRVKEDGYRTPKGVVKLAQQGDSYEPHVRMSIGEHGKLPCHVTWIEDSAYSPELAHGCTKPTSHDKLYVARITSSGSRNGTTYKQQKERDKRNVAIKTSKTARRGATRELLEAIADTDATKVLLEQLLADKHGGEIYDAAQLLGLGPDGDRWDKQTLILAESAFKAWTREHGVGAALYAVQLAKLQGGICENLNSIRHAAEYSTIDDREQRRLQEMFDRLRKARYQLSDGDVAIIKAFKLDEAGKPKGRPLVDLDLDEDLDLDSAEAALDAVRTSKRIWDGPEGQEPDEREFFDEDIAEHQLSTTETCPSCGAELGRGILESYASSDGTTCPECPKPKRSQKQKIAAALADATAAVG